MSVESHNHKLRLITQEIPTAYISNDQLLVKNETAVNDSILKIDLTQTIDLVQAVSV